MSGTKTADHVLIDLDEVYRFYGDMIFRLAYVHTCNRSDAEDIVQDVLIRALNNQKPFESPEHQKAWLLKVTLNRAKSLRTSAWFRHWAKEDDRIAAEEKEDFSDVYRAVCNLEEKSRSVIHLYYYENYDIKSIANILDLSESAVKTRLFRAREALREKLKGAYGEF